MPLCEGCGGNYDDKFKFCPYCGKAKSDPLDININVNVSSSDEWEICEITVVSNSKNSVLVDSIFGKGGYLFEATAIGPKGRYGAGWSEQLTPPPGLINSGFDFFTRKPDYTGVNDNGELIFDNRARVKFNALINKLVNDGWQPLGKGTKWYSEKFRRKVKKS